MEYHKKSVTVLDSILPTLKSLSGKYVFFKSVIKIVKREFKCSQVLFELFQLSKDFESNTMVVHTLFNFANTGLHF